MSQPMCDSLGIDTTIKVGDTVKSYTFPDTRPERLEQCYVEGVVESIVEVEGCDRYKIRVTKEVFSGEVVEIEGREYVVPPVNGTPTYFGKVCNGVIKLPTPVS